VLGQELLVWYAQNGRSLPWRRDRDPYRIWVSETMLQQTRVEAVLPRYEAFLAQLPDLPSLAAVPDERLNKLWEGLGYYSRARNLKRAAIAIEALGFFPSDFETLRKLPGFGPYTAGALCSIAFGQRRAAVDGNVLRIVSRLRAVEEPISLPSVKREAADFCLSAMPEGADPGAFNQALMDLGALLCTPRNPSCGACPLSARCQAFAGGNPALYPHRAPKRARVQERFAVYLFIQDGRALLRKRPSNGMLNSLWEFPHHLEPGPEIIGEPLLEFRHVFTHRIWEMRFFLAKPPRNTPEGCVWLNAEELIALPMPSAMAPMREMALKAL
jgi:A/G-specific adenine glycosylase